MRILPVQGEHFRFALLKYGVVSEAEIEKEGLRPVKVETKVFWIVSVGADCEKLSAKLAVTAQDTGAGVWLS